MHSGALQGSECGKLDDSGLDVRTACHHAASVFDAGRYHIANGPRTSMANTKAPKPRHRNLFEAQGCTPVGISQELGVSKDPSSYAVAPWSLLRLLYQSFEAWVCLHACMYHI